MRRPSATPPFIWVAWLCGLTPFLAIAGLCIGLNLQNPPYMTEVVTTTTTTTTEGSTTTAPPTTAPLICPTCNSSYYYPFDIDHSDSQSFYFGQAADYYILGESFSYMNTSHVAPYNITLTRYSKCTGSEQWSHTLCSIYSNYGQYISIDQTNGDTYFIYQCNVGGSNGNTFMDRYDIDGNLIWRSNITLLSSSAPVGDLESPITLNYEMQVLYFAFRNGVGQYTVCAQRMSNGTNIWCYSNSTYNPEFCGIVYNNALGLVYLNVYASNTYYVDILNNASGLIVDSFLTVNLTAGVGVDIDSNGGIYLFGRGLTSATAVVEKFDSAKSLQWHTIVTGTSNYNNGFTFSSRNLLYDNIHDIVIVAGDTRLYHPDPNYTYKLFIATFDGTSGAQLSYFENPTQNRTIDAYISIAGDYAQRTVFYNYEFTNRTTNIGTWQINSYCY